MGLREIGVTAVVKDFGRYISQVTRVAKAATSASKNITDAMEGERLMGQKLRAQADVMEQKLFDLAFAKEKDAAKTRLAAASLELLEHRVTMSKKKLTELTSAAKKSGIDFAKLAATLGKVAIAIGAVAPLDPSVARELGALLRRATPRGPMVWGALDGLDRMGVGAAPALPDVVDVMGNEGHPMYRSKTSKVLYGMRSHDASKAAERLEAEWERQDIVMMKRALRNIGR